MRYLSWASRMGHLTRMHHTTPEKPIWPVKISKETPVKDFLIGFTFVGFASLGVCTAGYQVWKYLDNIVEIQIKRKN